jgi:hypothetical protein
MGTSELIRVFASEMILATEDTEGTQKLVALNRGDLSVNSVTSVANAFREGLLHEFQT